MSNLRVFCVATVLGLTVGVQAAAPGDWIQLGKAQVHPTRVLARLNQVDADSLEKAQALYARLGLEVQYESTLVPGLVSLDSPQGALAPQAIAVPNPEQQAAELTARIIALRDSGLFQYVQPSYLKRLLLDPTDLRYVDGTLWGLRNLGMGGGVPGVDINARQAWDITTGDEDVIVAVIDTGVRYTHQDLRTQMWVNLNEVPGNGVDDDGNGYIDDIHGIDAYNQSGDPDDFDNLGHGTHVAGTIGASANDGYPHVGVAWDIKIMACKIAGGSTTVSWTEASVRAIDYAVAHGAKVMNASYGWYFFDPAERDAIAAAGQQGVMLIAAAGNEMNDNDDWPLYPASYPLDNVISVAAIDRADRLAAFSNFGLQTVDLGAPGVNIWSSVNDTDDAYFVLDGTSMAAPHVSGVTALIFSAFPNASVAEVRERLLQTVVKTPALTGFTASGGRVNAFRAIESAPDGVMEVTVTPPSESVLLGGSTNVVIEVEVRDVFPVIGATVTGRIVIGQNTTIVSFLDDGNPPDAQGDDGIYSVALDIPNDIDGLTIDITVTAAGKEDLQETVTYVVIPPPPNDDFENASKFPQAGGTVRSSNNYATVQPGEPAHAGVATVDATLWWVWSPIVSTDVLVDTAGCAFDAVLAVYQGNSLTDLTEIASADDVGDRLQPYLIFRAQAGQTYKIVVGGFNLEERGTVQLRIAYNGRPDTIPPDVVFTTPTGTRTDAPDFLVTGIAFDPQPDASGVKNVGVRLNSLGGGLPAAGTTNWAMPVLLEEGENLIEAWAIDHAGNDGSIVSIRVRYVPQDPTNDFFANASLLDDASGEQSGSNVRATKEKSEPNHAGNDGGKSLWWYWTAPADGLLSLTSSNSTYDTMLAVYTGDGKATEGGGYDLSTLVTVGSNDDAYEGVSWSELSLGVRSGETYRIALDGFSASSGDYVLNLSFTEGTVYTLNIEAGEGGQVTTPGGEYLEGSVIDVGALPNRGKVFGGWVGDLTSTENPLSVTVDQDLSLEARFTDPPYADDFESGDFNSALNYTLSPEGSATPWSVQSDTAAGGVYAARSGSVPAAANSSLLLTEVLDRGIASFAYKVDAEDNFDGLEFYLNGKLLRRWVGKVGWQTFEFEVVEGDNVMQWKYVKDFSVSSGLDAAYIDSIWLPLASAEGTEARLSLSYVREAVGLQLRGVVGRTYTVEASTDLIHWTPISTHTVVNGIIPVIDPNPPVQSPRFYRAVKP